MLPIVNRKLFLTGYPIDVHIVVVAPLAALVVT